jgi:hypothetical protein
MTIAEPKALVVTASCAMQQESRSALSLRSILNVSFIRIQNLTAGRQSLLRITHCTPVSRIGQCCDPHKRGFIQVKLLKNKCELPYLTVDLAARRLCPLLPSCCTAMGSARTKTRAVQRPRSEVYDE